MEHLWAPWRNLYVKHPQEERGNVFAEIARSSDDEANYVLARGKSCFALLNLYPYNTGHLMVVPYRATDALEDLSDDETARTDDDAQADEGGVDGGFSAPRIQRRDQPRRGGGRGHRQHLHIHLVPRWRATPIS
jgi:ATP adenylyltransferase